MQQTHFSRSQRWQDDGYDPDPHHVSPQTMPDFYDEEDK
jgi:hypothetical protein